MKGTANIAMELNAVILAGGKSSRFGKDKSRMELAGRRVLDNLLGVLRQFPFQQVAISAAKGKNTDWPVGVPIFFDDQEDLGPIGGISTALRHLRAGILVTACDMPFLSAPLIAWLLDHYDRESDAVIPKHAERIEPLLAIYTIRSLPHLESAIRSGCYALHLALEKARVRFIDVPAEFISELELSNINTPEDYVKAVKLTDGKR